MRALLNRFRTDTYGAVSLDWIVLTAGVVALGAGAASMVFEGSEDLGEAINASLSTGDTTGSSAATKN
ncbi:MAG: hypothetical protein MK180_12630 [Rhodobacteraceae bacterium]|nr:hypothetical protein [Paracoccaceae bacterium]